MMEMKITIEASELAAAIAKLAAAVEPHTITGVLVDANSPTQMPDPAATVVAPVNPTQTPAAAPGPVPTAAPAAAPVTGQTAPPTNAAAAPAPAPAVPVTAPTYNLDQIARAGAMLVDAGKMEQLLGLLGKYGVAAVTQLSPDQYGAFATELRALGAQI